MCVVLAKGFKCPGTGVPGSCWLSPLTWEPGSSSKATARVPAAINLTAERLLQKLIHLLASELP